MRISKGITLSGGLTMIADSSVATLKFSISNPNIGGTPENDEFGFAVGISNNYAIVGAYNETDPGGATGSGAAYIYNPDSGSLLHTLTNPSTGDKTNDEFGTAVDISENFAVVSAIGEEANGDLIGRAYTYDPSTGNQLSELVNPNPVGQLSDDFYGFNVAVSNTHAAVSAHQEGFEGKVYVFDPVTGNVSYTLDNPNDFGTATFDFFGFSISISDNYVVVGAPREGDANGTVSGKVYVYDVDTGNLLYTLDNPNAFGTSADDTFGYRVNNNDQYVIVGTPFEDETPGGSGVAYLFDITDGTLLQTFVNPSPVGFFDNYGLGVAVSDKYVAVGAPGESLTAGRVYTYDIATGDLLSIATEPTGVQTDAGFGLAIDVSDNYAIVSSPFEDAPGGANSGQVHIYELK